ncbi:MAG: hypothetical protein KDB79_08975 [Acidobacteria bacterium]|nr:hypothetical protein [Acidobacteriota bacterium]
MHNSEKKEFEYCLRIIDEIGSQITSSEVILDHDEFCLLKKDLIKKELKVDISLDLLAEHWGKPGFAKLINKHIENAAAGPSVAAIFGHVEEMARIRLNKDIRLRWFSKWESFSITGDWFTSPDTLDFVEMFMAVEAKLGLPVKSSYLPYGKYLSAPVKHFVKRTWEATRNLSETAGS